MRWIQAAFLLLGPVACFFILGGDVDGNALAVVTFILRVVIIVLVVVDVVVKTRACRSSALATGVFVVKLASIPFFVGNFLIQYLFVGGTLFFGVGFVLAAIAIPATWALMLSTSIYGWGAIIALRRERRLHIALVVVYAILLTVFVVDIAVGIALFVHSRTARRAQPAVAAESPA